MISTWINVMNTTTLNNIVDARNDDGIDVLYHWEKMSSGLLLVDYNK